MVSGLSRTCNKLKIFQLKNSSYDFPTIKYTKNVRFNEHKNKLVLVNLKLRRYSEFLRTPLGLKRKKGDREKGERGEEKKKRK